MRFASSFAFFLSLAALACGGRSGDDAGLHEARWVEPPPPPVVDAAAGPQTLATSAGAPLMRLAVDTKNAYFTGYQGGTVSEISLTTGARIDLATGRSYPYGIAVDASHVYWTDYEGATLERAPIGGGTVEAIGTTAFPNDLAFVGAHLYAGTASGVVEVPAAWGAAPPVLVTPGDVQSIAASSSAIVWCSSDHGTISQLAFARAAPLTLASQQTTPMRVAVDDTTAYWVAGEYGVDAVVSAPLGGGPTTVLSSTQNWVVDIAVDASGVYWTDVNLGTVTKLARGATQPIVIAANERGPWAIALDATSVYWTTLGDGVTGEVRRLAK